jgi:hypothetical protein
MTITTYATRLFGGMDIAVTYDSGAGTNLDLRPIDLDRIAAELIARTVDGRDRRRHQHDELGSR